MLSGMPALAQLIQAGTKQCVYAKLAGDVNGTRRTHAIEHGRVPVLVNRIYGN